jgi:hypothetical protein
MAFCLLCVPCVKKWYPHMGISTSIPPRLARADCRCMFVVDGPSERFTRRGAIHLKQGELEYGL